MQNNYRRAMKEAVRDTLYEFHQVQVVKEVGFPDKSQWGTIELG